MTDSTQDNITAKANNTNNKLNQEVGRNEGQVLGQMTDSQAISADKIGIVVSGGTVVYQNSPSPEVSQPQPKKNIPSLLPYLADRSNQECELEKTIQTHLKQRSNNPLVCIFHGDEYQCHDKFLDRLKERSLPRMLELDVQKDVIKVYSLPYLPGVKNLETLSDHLCCKLREATKQGCLASKAEINQIFGQYPSPTIIHTQLLAQDLEDEGLNYLDNLLNFWNNWPQLAPNQQLIVCISIKYKIKPLKIRGFFWLLRKLLDFLNLKKITNCYQSSKIDSTIKNKLGEISQSKFSQYQKLDGVVLTELSGICQSHVEEWANQTETKEFIGEAGVTKLMKSIREIFEQYEDLSMENLADLLIELLEDLEVHSEYSI